MSKKKPKKRKPATENAGDGSKVAKKKIKPREMIVADLTDDECILMDNLLQANEELSALTRVIARQARRIEQQQVEWTERMCETYEISDEYRSSLIYKSDTGQLIVRLAPSPAPKPPEPKGKKKVEKPSPPPEDEEVPVDEIPIEDEPELEPEEGLELEEEPELESEEEFPGEFEDEEEDEEDA